MNKLDLFATTYPLNVLISDNDPTHREATVKMLREIGYHPHEAFSDEALNSLAENGRYDVILLNVRITGIGHVDEASSIFREPRPLMIGVSQSARFDHTSFDSASSGILLFRPTTREELLAQLKYCCIMAGKFAPNYPPCPGGKE